MSVLIGMQMSNTDIGARALKGRDKAGTQINQRHEDHIYYKSSTVKGKQEMPRTFESFLSSLSSTTLQLTAFQTFFFEFGLLCLLLSSPLLSPFANFSFLAI